MTARRRPDWGEPPGPPPGEFLPDRPDLLRQVLWSRVRMGIDVDRFLAAGEHADPMAMAGMADAVELVLDAVRRGRRVAIFGDYDADGVTATALLQRGVAAMGADVVTYIPHRVNDGYGLNGDGLDELARQGAELVISCDCGTNAYEVVAQRPRGQRLIITDHHLPSERVAEPDALLNPHRPGDAYPYKELSGAGVAYKLLEALAGVAGGSLAEILPRLEQLVALGAIADVVPLLGENRRLVRSGLAQMEAAPLAGIAALVRVAGLERPVGSGGVSYQLAPRINAAGRMDDARLALDLLTVDEAEAAWPLAEHLENHNLARREATDAAISQAQERLDERGGPGAAIVLADERWSVGLVGLVAGRLVDLHHVPAFVMNRAGDECRGSARSVAGFNVVEALTSCAGYLSAFGGHAAAAGLTCSAANLEALEAGLVAAAAAEQPEGGWSRMLPIDAEVDLRALTVESVAALAELEPCGEGNPAPRFCGRDVVLKAASAFGRQGEHLRLWLSHGERVIEAIGWRRGQHVERYKKAARAGEPLDAVFSVGLSSWDGETTVQLELEDVRKSRRNLDLHRPTAVLA